MLLDITIALLFVVFFSVNGLIAFLLTASIQC